MTQLYVDLEFGVEGSTYSIAQQQTTDIRRGVPQLFSQSSFFCDIEGTVWYFSSSRFNGRPKSRYYSHISLTSTQQIHSLYIVHVGILWSLVCTALRSPTICTHAAIPSSITKPNIARYPTLFTQAGDQKIPFTNKLFIRVKLRQYEVTWRNNSTVLGPTILMLSR